MTTVRAMRAGEEGEVAAALADAFQRDAFAIWLVPTERARREGMSRMFKELLGVLPANAVVDVTDDLDAAALWLAPESEVFSPPPPGASPQVLEVFRRVNAAAPDQPFWYLKFIGARSLGGGRGSALLQARQAQTDLEGMPTALWTGAEVNLTFYRRNGYRVLERIDFAGASAWWLWRDPWG